MVFKNIFKILREWINWWLKPFPHRFNLPNHSSLRKHPFLLALRHWGRFARRNVCDSATETPYWWRNQCLHNESGSHGVPNINLSNFACLLVDFGEVLCSSAKRPQRRRASRSGCFRRLKSFQPKQGNQQAFFFLDSYQNLKQKFILQINKLNPHWI